MLQNVHKKVIIMRRFIGPCRNEPCSTDLIKKIKSSTFSSIHEIKVRIEAYKYKSTLIPIKSRCCYWN